MLTNFALWTIMITNLIIVLIPIIIFNIIFTRIDDIFTPGKEWVEITAIIVTIFIIYLINLEADIYSNRIKSFLKKMNQENIIKEEKIKELEKIINEIKINKK
jgi:hypothetical protein